MPKSLKIIAKSVVTLLFAQSAYSAKLPDNIKWIENNTSEEWASQKAERGGRISNFITSFPLTLRVYGPDSNGSFADVVRSITGWSLVAEHPNTDAIIPQLATHWAFDKDGMTMYFKLDKAAKWSDEKPIKGSDYAFAETFGRSKEIIAPYTNNYYEEFIDNVTVYDDYTISIKSKKKLPELHRYVNLSPMPEHFYGKPDKNYVREFNWKTPPSPGPYIISDVKKGKSITVSRLKTWWGDNHRYYRYRFNAEQINFKVIRKMEVAFLRFLKGELDTFHLTLPIYWHEKAKGKDFDNGYIHKLKFYNDVPRAKYGFWINSSRPPYDDLNVRRAFAHSVNFERLNQTVLRGDYERLNTFFEGVGDYTNLKVKARSFDCQKVEDYLTKSKWKRGTSGYWEKGGKRLSPEIVYTFEGFTPRFVVLKEEAKKCGIEYKLRLQQGSQGFKLALEKNHEIAFLGMGAGKIPEPWQYLHSANAKPQTNNFTMTTNKTIDGLIDSFRKSVNKKEMQKLIRQIQEEFHEESSWIPLYKVPYFRSAYWRWIQFPDVPGTKISSGIDFLSPDAGGTVWINQVLKEETLKAKKAGKAFKPVTVIDETYRVKG